MKLTDLNPKWLFSGGPHILDKNHNPVPQRDGIGVTFDCPCGCGLRRVVEFENPLDGKPVRADHPGPLWKREGTTFESLTLSPSILSDKEKGGCGWHGFVKNGEVTEA